MVIGEIGSFFSTTKQVAYYSTKTLLEYDALIIDLAVLSAYTTAQGGNPRELYISRKKQLEDFIKYKKVPLIYFAPQPQRLLFNKPGGGVESVTFDFLVPIPNISVVKQEGTTIEIVGKTPFTDFLTKYKQHFFYNSFFEAHSGTTIAETAHTKRVLGFFGTDFIFIPQLSQTIRKVESEFFTELFSVAKQVFNGSFGSSLPAWAEHYFLPNELELTSDIEESKRQISILNSLIEQKELERNVISQRKKVFTSSGVELELEVKSIFLELGFEFIESEENRDDLILKYGERYAVVEIKGVTKTAAEKHAAQLEKWSAGFIQKFEIIPKSILIINSFKDAPLVERDVISFPSQMVKYSSQREHCLITTVQLLNLYYTIINSPDRKAQLIDSLFSTIGIYSELNEWTLFIKKK